MSQGDPVFQYVLKDDPSKLDDQIDPDGAGGNHYIEDTNDVNDKFDHEDQEMIVGRPENGNGGVVVLPKGHGGAPNYPSVWAPGTGALWTKYPTGGAGQEQDDITDWQPSEAERQLMRQKLWEVTPDPTRTTGDGAEGPAGPLAQYIDPRTVNRVAKLKLTSPPNPNAANPSLYGSSSPPSIHPFPHVLQDDTTKYNDLVDELVVCTTEGAYLMRSYTEDGAVFYDPPVLISDASHENGLVPKQNTDFRDATAADLDGDGVLDIVLVTGPGTPDVAYLADPTDPLMKKVGVDSDDGGTTTRGGLRKHEFGRTYQGPGADAGTADEGPNDDVYTTTVLRDSTSVVAIDPDGDGVPDVVIVGTRKDLDYMVCCGDAGTIQDIATPAGGTSTDTESIDAAIMRPPLDPNLAITTGAEGADGTLGTADDTGDIMESTKITIVFGTGTAPSEDRGSVDFYLQIRAYKNSDNTRVDRTTSFADFNVNEKTLSQLPGSISAADMLLNPPKNPRSTHTVKFVEMKRSAVMGATGDAAVDNRLENHLYLGYQHQDLNVNNNAVLGHYYDPSDSLPDELEALSGGARRTAIAKESTLTEFMKDGMRGLDVLIMEDPTDATLDTAVVYMTSNGGSVYEIIPKRKTGEGLTYDRSDESDVKIGVMRVDGTTKDLSSTTEDETRDAEYTAGLVVVADFDGDDYPDVLSGRHISYNKAAAGTRKDDHPGQRGIYDTEPLEWWTFGVTPSAVEALDADGDGDMDLVIMPRGFDETGVPTTAGGGSIKPVLQILLNDGSGIFSRAERRVVADASFSIAGIVVPNELSTVAHVATTKAVSATKIVAGQLNTADDARDDFVVIWPSGAASVFASDSGSHGDIKAGHRYDIAGLRTGAQVTASKIIDVAVASLTGVAATDATKRPQQDVLLLDDTNNVHLIPGTSLAQLGSTTAAGSTGDATAQAGTVSVAVTPSAGALKKLDVGYVLRSGPDGAASGFLRDDAAAGGSELPLRKSGLDSSGTPTDTDADNGDTLKLAIIGQTDNAGKIRDELEPELRTPDIVLAGTHEVWMISPVKMIRVVSERYATAVPYKLHTYEAPHTERTPTSIQVRDSDRNGLDDVLLSFKKDTDNSNEIYRSIIYLYADFGADAAAVTALRTTCAADPRAADCGKYLGPAAGADLRREEKILSEASSSPADNGAGTIKMIIEDVDLDGYYDIIYAVEYSEGARVVLARKKHVTGQPIGESTATKEVGTYVNHGEKPQEHAQIAEIEAIRDSMANWLDAVLSSVKTTPTVLGVEEDISYGDQLYTGEDRFGIINRGAANTFNAGVQPQQIVPNTLGNEHPPTDNFATISEEAGGDYMLINQANTVSRQRCPAPREVVTPIDLQLQLDFVRLLHPQTICLSQRTITTY